MDKKLPFNPEKLRISWEKTPMEILFGAKNNPVISKLDVDPRRCLWYWTQGTLEIIFNDLNSRGATFKLLGDFS